MKRTTILTVLTLLAITMPLISTGCDTGGYNIEDYNVGETTPTTRPEMKNKLPETVNAIAFVTEKPVIPNAQPAPAKTNRFKPSGVLCIGRSSDFNLRSGGNPSKEGTQGRVTIDLENLRLYALKHIDDRDVTTRTIAGGNYKVLGGKDANLRLGYEYQNYEKLGTDEHFLTARAHFGLRPEEIDFDVEAVYLTRARGTVVNGVFSKIFPLGKYKGWKFSITPSLQATYVNGLFEDNGMSRIMPGATLCLDNGPWCLRLYGKYQQKLEVGAIESGPIFGFGLGYRF